MKMSFLKKICVGAAFAMATTFGSYAVVPSVTHAAQATVGFVDLLEVYGSYPRVQAAQAELLNLQKEYRAQFEAEGAGLDAEAKAKLESTLNEKLAKRQSALMGPLQKAIADAIRNVAKEKGLAQVVRADTMLFGGVDLTKSVIEALTKPAE